MPSKKTTVVSGRIPYDLKNQMVQENLTVRDCIEIAINIKRTPNKEYEAELRKLLAETDVLASKIASNNIRITELKEEIGFTGSLNELKEELIVSPIEESVQITLQHFNSWKGTSRLTIEDFIISDRGKGIIGHQLQKLDMTEEDYIVRLLDKADGSRQTTLDVE